jgi:hypothetical protein
MFFGRSFATIGYKSAISVNPLRREQCGLAITVSPEFKKKEKFARSSESLPTGLLCNQYNPEIRRQIRDTDSRQFPRLL